MTRAVDQKIYYALNGRSVKVFPMNDGSNQKGVLERTSYPWYIPRSYFKYNRVSHRIIRLGGEPPLSKRPSRILMHDPLTPNTGLRARYSQAFALLV